MIKVNESDNKQEYLQQIAGNKHYFDGLAQDCGNSIANAIELPQSCAKPMIYASFIHTCNSGHTITLYTRNVLLCMTTLKSLP